MCGSINPRICYSGLNYINTGDPSTSSSNRARLLTDPVGEVAPKVSLRHRSLSIPSESNNLPALLFSTVRLMAYTIERLATLKVSIETGKLPQAAITQKTNEYNVVKRGVSCLLKHISTAHSLPLVSEMKMSWQNQYTNNTAYFAKDFGENIRIFLQLCCLSAACGNNRKTIAEFFQQSGMIYIKEAVTCFCTKKNSAPLLSNLADTLDESADLPALLLGLLALKQTSEAHQTNAESEAYTMIDTAIDLCCLALAPSNASVTLTCISKTTQRLIYAPPL